MPHQHHTMTGGYTQSERELLLRAVVFAWGRYCCSKEENLVLVWSWCGVSNFLMWCCWCGVSDVAFLMRSFWCGVSDVVFLMRCFWCGVSDVVLRISFYSRWQTTYDGPLGCWPTEETIFSITVLLKPWSERYLISPCKQRDFWVSLTPPLPMQSLSACCSVLAWANALTDERARK